ncbi:ABC transporter F family member 3 [Nymphaea thermarum]|nr:ABC transporter F family member 3 [Nymphaea thermarum]
MPAEVQGNKEGHREEDEEEEPPASGSSCGLTSCKQFHISQVRMAVFSQHHVDGLDLSSNPLLYMMRCYPVGYDLCNTGIAPVPDLDAVEALIQGLVLFQGGVLMVSHDEHLISGSVGELWAVSEGKCREEGGGGAGSGGDGGGSGGDGVHGGGAWMEYQRRGKKRVEPSTEAQREPSPAHSDAHTPQEDDTSGQQNAQASVGAPTPQRQTPPVDQHALLLTTLQTLTSIVQSMAGNQRSQASPTGDTTAPPKEKATTVTFHHFMTMQPTVKSLVSYLMDNKISKKIRSI